MIIKQEKNAAGTAETAESENAGEDSAGAGQESAGEEQAGAGQESPGEEQAGAGQESSGEDQKPEAKEELPTIYSLVFTFPDGTAFNLDGGRSLSVEEANPDVSSLFESGGKGESLEIFDPEIKYPENPEQYKKDFTFTLPDALTEEERAAVKGVVLEVDRDCTSDIEAEGEQSFREENDVSEDSSLLSLETLALKAMKKSEEENTFTCSLSGLICTMQENPEIFFSIIEFEDDQGGITYSTIGNDGMCTWYLLPKEEIYSGIFGLEYSFKISTQNGTGSLSGFEIDDSDKEDDFSRYPLAMFKSLEYSFGAHVYICHSDGSMDYHTLGMDAGTYSVPLEGSTKALQMVPYTDFTSDLRVTYKVLFEDGSFRTFDGGTY
jgi:hypothetical protein